MIIIAEQTRSTRSFRVVKMIYSWFLDEAKNDALEDRSNQVIGLKSVSTTDVVSLIGNFDKADDRGGFNHLRTWKLVVNNNLNKVTLLSTLSSICDQAATWFDQDSWFKSLEQNDFLAYFLVRVKSFHWKMAGLYGNELLMVVIESPNSYYSHVVSNHGWFSNFKILKDDSLRQNIEALRFKFSNHRGLKRCINETLITKSVEQSLLKTTDQLDLRDKFFNRNERCSLMLKRLKWSRVSIDRSLGLLGALKRFEPAREMKTKTLQFKNN